MPQSNSELGQLFAASQESGSVYLTQKREESESYQIIFRATDGKTDKKKRIKISTTVEPSKLDQFWQLYTETVKSGMGGLRKKDKKKSKKAKKGK